MPFLAFRARVCSTVLWHSMPNLWLFFKYLVCPFLMLANFLYLSLRTCLTHQLKTGLWLIPCTTANSTVCTGWDTFNLDNFFYEVEPSFHCQQICQPAVVLHVTGLPCILVFYSVREIALLSLWLSTSMSLSKYLFLSELHWMYIDSEKILAISSVT